MNKIYVISHLKIEKNEELLELQKRIERLPVNEGDMQLILNHLDIEK